MRHNATTVIKRKVPDMGDETGTDPGAPTTPLLVTDPPVDAAPTDAAMTDAAVPRSAEPSTDALDPAPAADTPVSAPPRERGWRTLDEGPKGRPWRILSIVLLVIGCVLAPIGVTAAWAKNLVTNQDAYLEAVGPLITDPVIVDAAEAKIVAGVDTAITNLKLADRIGDELQTLGLPPRLASLATSYLSTFRDDINDRVAKLVDQVMQSPRLETLWNEANIKAHSAFVDLMQGRQSRLSSINLDLSTVVGQVKQRLSASGVDWAAQIPDVPIVFNLTGNANVQRLAGYYDTLTVLGTWLPIIALVLLLASAALAPSRLRGLSRAGGWLAFSMVVLAVGLIGGREYLISKVPAQPQVTQAFTRQLTVNLQDTMRLVAVIGAVIAVLAWLFGRSKSASSVRRAVRAFSGGVQDTRWQLAVRIVAGVVAVFLAVILLTMNDPKLVSALLLAIGAGLAGLIAFGPRRASVAPVAPVAPADESRPPVDVPG